MIGDYSRELLRTGIIELKAGNRETARRYLDRALYMSGDHDVMAEAWYWMSQLVEEPAQKRKALENCLANDLRHARARRALAVLDGRLKPDEIIDPEAAPATPRGAQDADTQRFMCPKCGGRMTFSPDGQSLACEYCTRATPLGAGPQPASDPPERDLRFASTSGADRDFLLAMATLRGHARPLAEQVFQCRGCGARYFLPAGQLSVTCAYCGSPHVVSFERSVELLAPDGILPHAFDAPRAAALLADWIQHRHAEALRRLPRRRRGSPEPPPYAGDTAPAPRGLYLPLWTFDLGGAIDYTGEVTEDEPLGLGARRPRLVRVTDSYPVMLSRLPIPASRKLSASFVRLLPTFDLTAVQPYDPRYLADWPAELYDIPMDEASLDARSQGFAMLKLDMAARLAPVRLLSTSSAHLTIESFRLILLPVWMAEIAPAAVPGGEGRMMQLVLINGHTGDICGELNDAPRKGPSGLMGWLKEMDLV